MLANLKLYLYHLIPRMGAAEDFDCGLGDAEVLGEKFDEGLVRLAIVSFSAEIDC